jgi:hypothetical protein
MGLCIIILKREVMEVVKWHDSGPCHGISVHSNCYQ